MEYNEESFNKAYEPIVKVVSEEQSFNIGKLTGTAITGFIDVEKFVSLERQVFFLEKKLPFQILIVTEGEHKDKDKDYKDKDKDKDKDYKDYKDGKDYKGIKIG